MARLVKPDGKKICDLCNDRRWGAPELAKAAGIALVTAIKTMKSEPVFRSTLQLVADAFDEKYIDLLEGSQSEKKKKERYKIHIVFVGRNKEDFDEDQLIALADKLNKLIGGSGDIDMEAIEDGSTILTLSLNEKDFRRLLSSLEKKNREMIASSPSIRRGRSSVATSTSWRTTIEILDDPIVDQLQATSIIIDRSTLLSLQSNSYRKRFRIIAAIAIAAFIIYAIISFYYTVILGK